ncbi:MAG: ABC transporter substrate-binding protein, partial [Geminicoccaceae bacterium]
LGWLAGPALAGTIVINTDTSDPAPKQAMQELIDGFKEANPDVEVEWNVFDHEGYKTSIRNFLTADAPDIAAWYAGNRMAPYVDAGLFEDVSDVWADNGLEEAFASSAASMTMDDKKWGVPYTFYQWGIYYRIDIFADLGIEPPTDWEGFLAACATIKESGIAPIAIGTKALWPTGGWFDYLNLRTNGYEFHMELTSGQVPYTDDRVKAVFAKWAELIEPGYFVANHAALDWQDALPLVAQGEAAMYLIGNFAVAPLRDAGLTDDQLGFMQFPAITPDIPMAEDAPTDTLHIPANASNKEDAKKFLAYLAQPDVQTKINATLGQLPVNSQSEVPEDPFLSAGFEMLSNAHALAQFYDRDAVAEMAKAGMEGFQEFMVKPERGEQIMERLEKIRSRVHK